jgi:hypothetical protein
MVAPNTTRSMPAHKALAMHMGQGSQVVYMVYPASEMVFNFLQARRTERSSAWELGSCSCFTAFVARIRVSPVLLWTISVPNGVGRGVSSVRAVKL